MGLLRKSSKLFRLLSSSVGRRGLLNGVAMTVEHESGLASLRPNTVVDVGANKGQFALFARRYFPGCRVLAFEPLPGPAERFRRLFRADSQVRLFELAIGPEAREATMHVSAREDSSSLLPIGAAQSEIFPGTEQAGVHSIRMARLGDILTEDDIAPPALLKIDVQGFEQEVLLGSDALLPRFRWIYVECSYMELYDGQALADDIENLLADRGFSLAGRFNLIEDPVRGPVQGDFLFEQGGGTFGALRPFPL